jgi:hypothetical protein
MKLASWSAWDLINGFDQYLYLGAESLLHALHDIL